jgi:hypothetical protein
MHLKSSSKYTIPKVYFQEAVVGSELDSIYAKKFRAKNTNLKPLKSGEGIKEAKENLCKGS